jgi:TonB family protein
MSNSGTLEEFFIDSKKYRRTYSADTLNQTEVATESGLYRSGDQRWPSPSELQVRNEVLQPLYLALRDQHNLRLDKIDWQVGASKLPCIILRRTDMTISDNGLQKFCFDPGTVLLRYTRGGGWDETAYNNFVLFQDRYVPLEIEVTHAGKAFLKIHVEELESIIHVDDALFEPPKGNDGPLAGRISISSAILMRDYIASRATPAYPRGVRGKVTVNFVVGKDGRVIEAVAVDGPAELRGAAVEAVRKYRFRPFLVQGQPVEVESSTFFDMR